MIAMAAFGSQQTDVRPEKPAVTEATPSASIEISAYKLFGAYEENSVRAEKLFKGKYVKVTGKIGKIGRDITRTAFVTLETSRDMIGPRHKIQAMFKDSDMVVELSKGQEVSVVCKVSGKVSNLICRDAHIVK